MKNAKFIVHFRCGEKQKEKFVQMCTPHRPNSILSFAVLVGGILHER